MNEIYCIVHKSGVIVRHQIDADTPYSLSEDGTIAAFGSEDEAQDILATYADYPTEEFKIVRFTEAD